MRPKYERDRGEPVGSIEFVLPEELATALVPGAGKLHLLRNGEVLLVLTHPESATSDEIDYIRNGMMVLVNEGVCDSAIVIPEGWDLKVGRVRRKQ